MLTGFKGKSMKKKKLKCVGGKRVNFSNQVNN